MENTTDIEFSGVRLLSSPSFHYKFVNCKNAYIHDMEIYVDSQGSIEFSRLWANGSPDGWKLPMPPIYIGALNTDGIDI